MTLLIAYFLFILCVLLESILYLTPAYPACLPRQPGRLPFIHPARGFVPLFLDSVYTHDDCACDVTGTDITGGFTGDSAACRGSGHRSFQHWQQLSSFSKYVASRIQRLGSAQTKSVTLLLKTSCACLVRCLPQAAGAAEPGRQRNTKRSSRTCRKRRSASTSYKWSSSASSACMPSTGARIHHDTPV